MTLLIIQQINKKFRSKTSLSMASSPIDILKKRTFVIKKNLSRLKKINLDNRVAIEPRPT